MINVTLDMRPLNVALNSALGVGMGFASKEAVESNVKLLAASINQKIHPEIERHGKEGSLGHIFKIRRSTTIDWRGKLTQPDASKRNRSYSLKVKPVFGGGGPSGHYSMELFIQAEVIEDKGGTRFPIEEKVAKQAKEKNIELKRHVYPNSPAYLETTRNATRVVGAGKYRVTEGSSKKIERVVIPTRANYALKKSAPWKNPHHDKFKAFLAKYMTAFFVSRKGDMQKSFMPGTRMIVNIMYEQDAKHRLPYPPFASPAPGLTLMDGRIPYRGYRRNVKIQNEAKSKMIKAVNAKTVAFFAKQNPTVKT